MSAKKADIFIYKSFYKYSANQLYSIIKEKLENMTIDQIFTKFLQNHYFCYYTYENPYDKPILDISILPTLTDDNLTLQGKMEFKKYDHNLADQEEALIHQYNFTKTFYLIENSEQLEINYRHLDNYLQEANKKIKAQLNFIRSQYQGKDDSIFKFDLLGFMIEDNFQPMLEEDYSEEPISTLDQYDFCFYEE